MNTNEVEFIATVVYDIDDEDGTFVVAEVFHTARGYGFAGYFIDEHGEANRVGNVIKFYATADAAIAYALVA